MAYHRVVIRLGHMSVVQRLAGKNGLLSGRLCTIALLTLVLRRLEPVLRLSVDGSSDDRARIVAELVHVLQSHRRRTRTTLTRVPYLLTASLVGQICCGA